MDVETGDSVKFGIQQKQFDENFFAVYYKMMTFDQFKKINKLSITVAVCVRIDGKHNQSVVNRITWLRNPREEQFMLEDFVKTDKVMEIAPDTV